MHSGKVVAIICEKNSSLFQKLFYSSNMEKIYLVFQIISFIKIESNQSSPLCTKGVGDSLVDLGNSGGRLCHKLCAE